VVTYLLTEESTESGSVFVVGGGQTYRVAQFQNAGVTFAEPPSLRDVAERWSEITDLSDVTLGKNPVGSRPPPTCRSVGQAGDDGVNVVALGAEAVGGVVGVGVAEGDGADDVTVFCDVEGLADRVGVHRGRGLGDGV